MLKAAPIDRLLRQRRLTVLHTPVFISEILHGFRSSRAQDRWRENLAFALDELKPSGYFLDKTEVWREELVCGRGPFARHFLPARQSRRWQLSAERWEMILRDRLRSGDLTDVWETALPEIEAGRTMRQNQRRIAREIREDISSRMRASGRGRLSDIPFNEALKRDRQLWARELMDLVEPSRAGALYAQWQRNPSRFPFYTSFVEGIAYFGYHAGVRQNDPIDTNAQADFEQLCYLNWADAIVSNDTAFLRMAFDALWKPRNKRLLTCEEFAQYVAHA
jgi:hypothetical protein